jgi:hypothetical protein
LNQSLLVRCRITATSLPMTMKARNITFILRGVIALLFKSRYAGPNAEFVHRYLGSFGV